jgi:hypothetical protein
MSAFDNVDISRSNNQKFSGGTPFETVHEFVSISNKVRRRRRRRRRMNIFIFIFYFILSIIILYYRNSKTFWILQHLILGHVG